MRIDTPVVPPIQIIETLPYFCGLRLDWKGNYHHDSKGAYWSVVEWEFPVGLENVERATLGELYPSFNTPDQWEYWPDEQIPFGVQRKVIAALTKAGVKCQ